MAVGGAVVGAAGDAVFLLTGYIAAICIFNAQLSDTDRQLVEGYLAHMYGLEGSLPGDHPYKSNPPYTPSSAYYLNHAMLR